MTLETPRAVAHQAPLSMGFPRQEYWSGLPFPSQGIFPTQESNPCLPHHNLLYCRQILSWLSHWGSHSYQYNLTKGTEQFILKHHEWEVWCPHPHQHRRMFLSQPLWCMCGDLSLGFHLHFPKATYLRSNNVHITTIWWLFWWNT